MHCWLRESEDIPCQAACVGHILWSRLSVNLHPHHACCSASTLGHPLWYLIKPICGHKLDVKAGKETGLYWRLQTSWQTWLPSLPVSYPVYLFPDLQMSSLDSQTYTPLCMCIQTRYSDHSMRQWRNKIAFIQKICQIASKGLFTPKQVSGTKNWYDLAKQSVFECNQIMVLCNCSVTGHVTKTTNHIGRPIFFAVQ